MWQWFTGDPILNRMEYKIDQLRRQMMTLAEAVAALVGAISALDTAVHAEIEALKAAIAAQDPAGTAAAIDAISKATATVAQDVKDLNDSLAPPAPPPVV